MDASEGQGIDSNGAAVTIACRHARSGPDCEPSRLSARRSRVARCYCRVDAPRIRSTEWPDRTPQRVVRPKRLHDMRGNRLIPIALLGLAPVWAQNSAPEQPPEIIGRTTVTDIIVPVTVHDRDGNMVNGLQPRSFHLYDNDKEQNIAVD